MLVAHSQAPRAYPKPPLKIHPYVCGEGGGAKGALSTEHHVDLSSPPVKDVSVP